MGRKVFISFLGTNNYVQCIYDINGVLSEPVRFVQEALIDHICKDWAEEDRILIFCTSKEKTGEAGSKELNWLDNGQSRTAEEIEKIGLQHRLMDLQARIGLKAQFELHEIEAGFSEEEIWSIFDTVYAELKDEDQIYFDVTHAFRSIPLFSTVLFNYSKFMRGTRLISIMYGAFEKLGPAYKVKEIPLEQRIAPVIDLTNIARLQEYNQIASSLKDFGKVAPLRDVISETQANATDMTVQQLSRSITKLDEYIATINLKELKNGTFIRDFRGNYRRAKRVLEKPIANILEELYKQTAEFEDRPCYRNIEAAINWTIKHDMLMQTYPLAEEYIVLRIADMFNDYKPENFSAKDFRFFVSSVLGMPDEDFQQKNWKEKLADYPDVANIIADSPIVQDLRPMYEPIRSARNSLAHGNGAISYAELKNRISCIRDCIEFLNR